MCVEEEERLKSSHGGSVNHVKEQEFQTIRETLVG
jgi:hypothetical protein